MTVSSAGTLMGEERLGAVGRASAVGGINGRASSCCWLLVLNHVFKSVNELFFNVYKFHETVFKL